MNSKMNITKTMFHEGQVHLYTGNGKGKTTAAFGLAVRAAMSGKRVYIAQFVKSMKYNETRITEFVKNIRIEQFGCGCMLDREPNKADKIAAHEGLRVCSKELSRGDVDMVILDEITIALHLHLLDLNEVLHVLEKRSEKVEVVLTGRYAPQELIEYSDLATDMKEVKHYYAQKGLLSRDGIDK